jgi:hypothetical protein
MDYMPPYVSTDTSKEAAVAIRPKAGLLREMVFGHIEKCGGATCDEIEVALAMKHQTASARIRELVLEERLLDSGLRRLTRSNKNAIVWVIDGR